MPEHYFDVPPRSEQRTVHIRHHCAFGRRGDKLNFGRGELAGPGSDSDSGHRCRWSRFAIDQNHNTSHVILRTEFKKRGPRWRWRRQQCINLHHALKGASKNEDNHGARA